MQQVNGNAQDIIDRHARRISTQAVLRNQRNTKANIWFFDSPKNGQRLLIEGDIPFIYAVLLEGDKNVSTYQIAPPAFPVLSNGINRTVEIGARLQMVDGSIVWWDFRRLEALSARERQKAAKNEDMESAAQSAGASYQIKSDLELRGQETAFDNWTNLCAAITRCRGHVMAHERMVFKKFLDAHAVFPMSALFDVENIDRAFMNGVVATSLLNGVLTTDLVTQLYGPHSILKRVGHD